LMMKGIVERMRRYFDAQEELRERVLEGSRQVVRHSAKAIAAMHRGDLPSAEEMLKHARAGIASLEEAIKAEPYLAESGTVLAAFQEYCEAAVMHAFLERGEIPEPEEVGIPYKAYLAALADVAGELRRRALDLIRANEVQAAERVLERMEGILELLMEFDYPDAVLPGMKRRQDMVRRMVEKTRGDVTMAIRQQRLEDALRRAERGEFE
jgi:translin